MSNLPSPQTNLHNVYLESDRTEARKFRIHEVLSEFADPPLTPMHVIVIENEYSVFPRYIRVLSSKLICQSAAFQVSERQLIEDYECSSNRLNFGISGCSLRAILSDSSKARLSSDLLKRE